MPDPLSALINQQSALLRQGAALRQSVRCTTLAGDLL
jgi:hypothetical protein